MSSIQILASTSTSSNGTTPSDPQHNIKRKFENALHTLDQAVALSPISGDNVQPSPAKKMRTGRSLYSTLAKYGIRKDPGESTPSKSNEFDSLSKTAPHLAAILSRTASRTKKAFPFKHATPTFTSTTSTSASSAPSLHPASEYRPSSTASFLSRLGTFKLTTYANKAPAVDAVAAAKCGWVNDGKDRLVCGICDVSWVVLGTRGMSRDAANALVEKQRVQLVDMHKAGCPWRTRQCDDSIYRIPLQSPLAMAREIKSRGAILDSILEGVEIKHPLTSVQVSVLMSTISSVKPPPPVPLDTDRPSSVIEPETHGDSTQPAPAEPSATAVLTALFGWAILPPAPPSERVPRTPSLSRASSVTSVPSTPLRSMYALPSTPVRQLARSPSLASSREGTPTPSHYTPRASLTQRPSTPTIASLERAKEQAMEVKPETALLHCALCQRKIGLWAFIAAPSTGTSSEVVEGGVSLSSTPPVPETPRGGSRIQKRQLDVLKEHRSYCPYVVRSTVVPSFPAPQPLTAAPPTSTSSHTRTSSVMSTSSVSSSSVNVHTVPGAAEGWRAVLAVVLRCGMAQRQRLGLNRARSHRVGAEGSGMGASETVQDGSGESAMEVDPIEAMVAGVKSRGGKDLLKYVKGLLG